MTETDRTPAAPAGTPAEPAANPAGAGAAAAPDPATTYRAPRNQWLDVWDQFKSHRGALIGAAVFILILLAVTVGPYIWTIDPTYIDIRAKNQGPTLAHPLGTDQLGRDTLARMLAGGRVSIAVGLTAMALSIVIGTVIGVIAGYFKRLDGPLMRPGSPQSMQPVHLSPKSQRSRDGPRSRDGSRSPTIPSFCAGRRRSSAPSRPPCLSHRMPSRW